MPSVYPFFLKTFREFTDIQKIALPVVESGENCIITAPPGSGKTEAALLPILNKLNDNPGLDGIYAIYITPLRALNRDLQKRLETFEKEFGIKIGVRHGDTKQSVRSRQAIKPPQILITTPESMQNILVSKRLRTALKNVKSVIVDELHELYYNKRGTQLSVALERLYELCGEFQRIGISATIGDVNNAAQFLCGSRKYRIVRSEKEKQMNISVEMPDSAQKEHKGFSEAFSLDRASIARIERIANLIRGSSATLMFANTRQIVESLGNKLITFNGLDPFGGIGVHHSSLDRDERIAMEDAFKRGEVRSLIATSSLELGIDIGKVDLVIQYGSPRQVTRLVQRVGRSGHGEERAAKGVIIVANAIDALESTAIASLVKERALERREFERKPYDVLVNQTCAMALEYKSYSVEFLYELLKRTSAYSDLDRGELAKVLEFAGTHHLIRFNGSLIGMGSRTRTYFLENISVIPDTQRFLVKNASTNRPISSLDEGFVSSYIEDGSTFITKGLAWKVLSVEGNVIYVEPSIDIEAAIPDWEGEDIPISREVAKLAFELLDNKSGAVNELLSGGARDAVLELIEKQRAYKLPKESTVLVEGLEERTIVYTAMGKLANDLLARVLGQLAASEIGGGVSVRSNAYTIFLDHGGARRAPNMGRVFELFKNFKITLGKESVFLLNSDLFRYKFAQIAKLFGIVEKKAVVTKNAANKLVGFYKDTPIFEEALRDLSKNYFNVQEVLRFQREFREGKLGLVVFESEGSPLAKEIMRYAYYYRELFLPLRPNSEEVEQFAEGIQNKNVELICTFCGFRFGRKLQDIRDNEKVLCVSCKSPMVAAYTEGYEGIMLKKKRGSKLTKSEREVYREMLNNASLVDAYGKRALAALSTYGIGIATASRVLKMLRTNFNLFVIDVINAQKQFIKTRKYWKATS